MGGRRAARRLEMISAKCKGVLVGKIKGKKAQGRPRRALNDSLKSNVEKQRTILNGHAFLSQHVAVWCEHILS